MGGKSGTITARNGKDVATDGKVGGKNGNVWRERGHIQAVRCAAACGGDRAVCVCMRLFRCQRGQVDSRI